jgi:phage tail protein X
MRKAYIRTAAIVTAIALSLSNVALADPLAPGRPAGVHAAQMGDKEWFVFGGLAVLAAAVLIANNGSGEHTPVVSPPITVVTPTTS